MQSTPRIRKSLFAAACWLALALTSPSGQAGQQQLWGSDSNPWPSRPPAQTNLDPLPTAGPPPQNWVFFTPQDENTSATVLFLVNTSAVDVVVPIQTFYTNGSLTINTTVPVPAHGLVRICSDTVSTVSASWASTVLINFTTFSAYGKIGLPPGVLVEGYVVWNTSGTYDPLTSLQTLPLRFMTSDGRLF